MHSTLPLAIATLVSVGIIVIGCFYVAAPEQIVGGFGLSHLHPMLTLAPGSVSRESGTSQRDWPC